MSISRPGVKGRASLWAWPQQTQERGSGSSQDVSAKHQPWDLWFYHNGDLSSWFCYTADVSSGDQLWGMRAASLDRAWTPFKYHSQHIHVFERRGWRGVWVELKGGLVFLMFRWHIRFRKFPKRRPQSCWNLNLCFLVEFKTSTKREEEETEKPGEPQEIWTGTKKTQSIFGVNQRPAGWRNQEMKSNQARSLLTRRLSMQKSLP